MFAAGGNPGMGMALQALGQGLAPQNAGGGQSGQILAQMLRQRQGGQMGQMPQQGAPAQPEIDPATGQPAAPTGQGAGGDYMQRLAQVMMAGRMPMR